MVSDVTPQALTCPAVATSLFVDVGVYLSKLMAANAVGLFTPVVPAPAKIFPVGDWLQMGGVHTVMHSAQMIQVQALGDSANEVFIHQPVHQTKPLLPVATAITLRTDPASPEPTISRLSVRDKFRQQIFNRPRIGRHSGNSTFLDVGAGDVGSVYPPTHHNPKEIP